MKLIFGTALSITILTPRGEIPRTQILMDTEEGRLVVVLPGANGGPPAAVRGLPQIEPGSRWQLQLVETDVGWVPKGLWEGMVRLDAPPPYNLNGLSYAPDQLPRVMLLDEAGIPGVGDADAEALVRGALERWTEVGCSTFAYAWGGWTDAGIEEDGLDVIRWESEEWTWGAEVAGFTMTRFEQDGDSVRPAEADLVLNAVDWVWDASSGDVYAEPQTLHVGSVLTHELGHAAGMDHNYEDPAATMFYAYIGGSWLESLAGDDRRGLCENYPTGSGECAADADCGTGRYCLSLDGVTVCEEERAGIGDFCSRLDYDCASLCVFTDELALEGYCSTPCEVDADCPEGWWCDDPGLSAFPDPPAGACQTDAPPWSEDPGDSGVEVDAEGPTGCACSTAPDGRAPGGATAVWAGALLGALLGRKRIRSPPPIRCRLSGERHRAAPHEDVL